MGKTIFGIIFIALGTLFLLTNTGVIEMDLSTIIATYWPILIIFWGASTFVKALLRSFSRRNRNSNSWASTSLIWGLVLMAIGIIIQGNNLAYFEIGWSHIWNWVWPLLIIYIGLKILFKRNLFTVSIDTEDPKSRANESKRIHSSKRKQLIGEINLGGSPWQLEDLFLWCGVGATKVDFTTAILTEGETVVDISGWVGDITVLVPQDMDINATIDVRVGEGTLFGHNQGGSARFLSYKSEDYELARKKVLLLVSLGVGEVTVKRVN
jgi:lia operon protein LiaF